MTIILILSDTNRKNNCSPNSFLLRDDLFIIPSLKSCLRNQLKSIQNDVPSSRYYVSSWSNLDTYDKKSTLNVKYRIIKND